MTHLERKQLREAIVNDPCTDSKTLARRYGYARSYIQRFKVCEPRLEKRRIRRKTFMLVAELLKTDKSFKTLGREYRVSAQYVAQICKRLHNVGLERGMYGIPVAVVV